MSAKIFSCRKIIKLWFHKMHKNDGKSCIHKRLTKSRYHSSHIFLTENLIIFLYARISTWNSLLLSSIFFIAELVLSWYLRIWQWLSLSYGIKGSWNLFYHASPIYDIPKLGIWEYKTSFIQSTYAIYCRYYCVYSSAKYNCWKSINYLKLQRWNSLLFQFDPAEIGVKKNKAN